MRRLSSQFKTCDATGEIVSVCSREVLSRPQAVEEMLIQKVEGLRTVRNAMNRQDFELCAPIALRSIPVDE